MEFKDRNINKERFDIEDPTLKLIYEIMSLRTENIKLSCENNKLKKKVGELQQNKNRKGVFSLMDENEDYKVILVKKKRYN